MTMCPRRAFARSLSYHLWAAVFLLAVFLGPSVATACPMCKAGLAGEHDRLIQAWGISIVFLLSMPFLLVASFSAYMYVLVRRARRDASAKRAAPRDPAHWAEDAEPLGAEPLGQRERIGV